MSLSGARQQITEAVTNWDGVSVHPHRFGGVEYRIGRREIGHIHGDYLLDIPFPTKVRHEVVAAGQARPHHILPESGWISFYIDEPADVEQAVALLRRSFQIAANQRRARPRAGIEEGTTHEP